jgi:hypothetical protein
MGTTEKFIRIIRKRSQEHRAAMDRVTDLPLIIAAILRQELDSLIRVLYLLSIQSLEERERLISQTLAGEKWTIVTEKGTNREIKDREMVDAANKLHGWANLAYRFGCSFIHLSNFHNYSDQNPFEMLSETEKRDLLMYLRQYHNGPSKDHPSFDELKNYFPNVFKKIADNLECYLEHLENSDLGQVL